MPYVPPSPVPASAPVVRDILRAIGYRKRTAYVVSAETVEIFGTYWDGGSRSEYTAVSLSDFRAAHGRRFDPPQFGGPRAAPVVPMEPGIVVVEHGISCGKPATARIHVHPADLARLLPGAPAPVVLPAEVVPAPALPAPDVRSFRSAVPRPVPSDRAIRAAEDRYAAG